MNVVTIGNGRRCDTCGKYKSTLFFHHSHRGGQGLCLECRGKDERLHIPLGRGVMFRLHKNDLAQIERLKEYFDLTSPKPAPKSRASSLAEAEAMG